MAEIQSAEVLAEIVDICGTPIEYPSSYPLSVMRVHANTEAELSWSKVQYPELLQVRVPAGFNAKLDEPAHQRRELRPEYTRRVLELRLKADKAERHDGQAVSHG